MLENHRKSKIKRSRKCGFRSRTRTRKGRRILSNKRRKGCKLKTA
ncbi:MAG: 50S ribosomal protein L34 [Planctomycetota bacterium]